VKSDDIDRMIEEMTEQPKREWENVTDDALIEEVRRRGFTIRDAQISAKQKPVAWLDSGLGFFYWASEFNDRPVPPGFEPLYTAPVHASDISQEPVDETAKDRHGACVTCGALVEDQIIKQPKREWVGLTPMEFNSIKDTSTTIGYAITKTEAMLKEKNAS